MSNKKTFPFFIFLVNYFPLLFFISGFGLLKFINQPFSILLSIGIFYIYLLPPILGRIIILLFGKPNGTVSIHSKMYLKWWVLTQLQLPFNRFPFLEEILRLVPGLYSLWLRLWGSKVSLVIYWAPGVEMLDRYLLEIQPRVLFGWNCKMSSHTLTEIDGIKKLLIAPILIETEAIVGSFSKISAGCIIHKREILPSTQLMAPFNYFKNGKRLSRK